ncbi:hypothetical protein [Thiomicrospira microaerophila]|uniref:hypothetical protein n=1 Tax=Thiomicrospira microaerophila TaxID=406020 RepID=UPI000698260A|nr:hypothetical protein [Thiomicrospira microaerophila]
MNTLLKQRGFSLVYFLILVGIVSGAGLMYLKPNAQTLKLNQQQKQLDLLQQAKLNLLIYAANLPEIQITNTSSGFFPNDRVPSPGYLPCPDSNGDGAMNTPCGQGVDFAAGRLPQGIHSRYVQFNPSNTPIYYVVDSRYVIQNSDYNNPPTQRYAPLNPNSPGSGFLRLGHQTNIVAFLFIDERDFNHFLTDPTIGQFSRPMLVAAITHNEWHGMLLQRLRPQRHKLCRLPNAQAHWFNDCNNQTNPSTACPADFSRDDNPVGANWRGIMTCP